MSSRVKIYFDGGCRPNPGTMEIAVVAAGRTHVLRDLGQGTSLDAEWLALIHAFRIGLELGGPTSFVLVGDAANVIRQAKGADKARGAAIGHLGTLRGMAAGSAMPRIRYIKRSRNLAGIALARLHGR
jgi:ribonuclease HI